MRGSARSAPSGRNEPFEDSDAGAPLTLTLSRRGRGDRNPAPSPWGEGFARVASGELDGRPVDQHLGGSLGDGGRRHPHGDDGVRALLLGVFLQRRESLLA